MLTRKTGARKDSGDKEIFRLLRMGDEAQYVRGRETIMLRMQLTSVAQQTQIKTGTPPFYIHRCHGTAELWAHECLSRNEAQLGE